jgi:hypothetical protein
MTWETVRTPDRYLEPPEPAEWSCPVCEQDSQDCPCGTCEACGERDEVRKYKIEDDEAWLCDACQEGTPA